MVAKNSDFSVQVTRWLSEEKNNLFDSQYGIISNWKWLELEAKRVNGIIKCNFKNTLGRIIPEQRAVFVMELQCKFINTLLNER